MKIAGLISRFENRSAGTDSKTATTNGGAYQQQTDYDRDEIPQEIPERAKASPRASSPGRLNIRQAMLNLRSSRSKSPGTLRNTPLDPAEPAEQKEKHLTSIPSTATVQARVDDILKPSLPLRTRIASADETKVSCSNDLLAMVDASNEEEDNMREFMITEHSNRTLVIDNKKKKSQNSTLPDTPWSSRNLCGGTRDLRIEESPEEGQNPKKSSVPEYEAEYGTLALKDDEEPLDIGNNNNNDDEESLPPEVKAMSAVSEKAKKKSKSSPSVLKCHSMTDDVNNKKDSTSSRKLRNNSSRQATGNSGNSDHNKPTSSRRLSPGLWKRRFSNEKTESKKQEISVEPRDDDSTRSVRPPTRSFSAGNLANAKHKAKSFRERKARSQSPADPKSSDRKPRPGQKKSERNLLGKLKSVESVSKSRNSNDSNVPSDSSAQYRPPRRIRGRSPGDIGVERKDSSEPGGEDDKVEDSYSRPTLVKLGSSRGRSPGTIQKSINMTGEIYRSQSPGSLNREGQLQNDAVTKSPATLMRMSYSSRTKSPGRLVSLNKSSGHSNGNRSQSPSASRVATDRRAQESFRRSGLSTRSRSPGALVFNKDRPTSPTSNGDITFDPQPMSTKKMDKVIPPSSPFQLKSSSRLGGTEITVPARSRSPERGKVIEAESPVDESLSSKNLSVPRAKSPGALARRPTKNPRTTQTKKAQSLFEKKSPSSTHSSPKLKLSMDDEAITKTSDQSLSFSSFPEND